MAVSVTKDGVTLTGSGSGDSAITISAVPNEGKQKVVLFRIQVNSKLYKEITVTQTAMDVGDDAYVYYQQYLGTVVPSVSVWGEANMTKYGYVGSGKAPYRMEFDWKVEEVPDNAMKNQVALEAIYLPKCVSKIGVSAFEGCTNFQWVGLTTDSALTEIGASAFKGCTQMEGLTLGNGNSIKIGESAFEGDTALTRLSYQGTTQPAVTSVGIGAFKDCTSLEALGLKVNGPILSDAFNGCKALTDFPTIASNTMVIGDNAFMNCEKMVTGNKMSTYIRFIGANAFKGCTALNATSFTKLNSLGVGAFAGCKGLTTLNMSKCPLTKIPQGAFAQCENMTSITLPGQLKTIGASAFALCKALTSIEIPSTVNTIGASPFLGCSALKTIRCCATTPPALTGASPLGVSVGSGFKIEVPSASLSAYQADTNWRTYKNYLVGY